jgi:CHAD domain-containing protein
MSYELKSDETLDDSLKRIFRRQIENAEAIVRGDKMSEDTPVHDVRKRLKKARAALNLVRKEIGRGLFRQQDRCLRDAGRLISDVRDAEVRLQTVRELQSIVRHPGRAAYRSVELALMMELESFIGAFADWQGQALPMLEKVRAATDHWALDHFNARELCCAVQSSYKCARNTLAHARNHPTVDNFHEVRKQAKTLWLQLRILRPVNEVVLKTVTDELKAVIDLLGRAHDLTFLGERISTDQGNGGWRREGDKLLAVIEVSQQDLQRGAADLAERFFAERPRDFGARVKSWLEEWHGSRPGSVAVALAH